MAIACPTRSYPIESDSNQPNEGQRATRARATSTHRGREKGKRGHRGRCCFSYLRDVWDCLCVVVWVDRPANLSEIGPRHADAGNLNRSKKSYTRAVETSSNYLLACFCFLISFWFLLGLVFPKQKENQARINTIPQCNSHHQQKQGQ